MEDMHSGLRGPKARISDIACVKEACANYDQPGTDIIVSNGTYPTQSGRVRNASASLAVLSFVND